jgi:hypothetical protein
MRRATRRYKRNGKRWQCRFAMILAGCNARAMKFK